MSKRPLIAVLVVGAFSLLVTGALVAWSWSQVIEAVRIYNRGF